MLAAVALALFGLLSMHGWGSHTRGHGMAMAPATSTVTMNSGHSTQKQTAEMDDHTPRADGDQSRGAASAGGDEMPGGGRGAWLLGLCLAVITALLLGFALLLARRRVCVRRLLLPTWPHWVPLGRDRDPPDRLQLRVIRC